MDILRKITLRGYKSIRALEDFHLGPLTVMIGANGAGKSNLISFFKILKWIMQTPGDMQLYTAKSGGASSMLYYGAETTNTIDVELAFETSAGTNEYSLCLQSTERDNFVFAYEHYRFMHNNRTSEADWNHTFSGHQETGLIHKTDEGDQTAKIILDNIRRWGIFQFHNTSGTSRFKRRWNSNDKMHLKEDGGNLAPFLLHLRETRKNYYDRIVEYIHTIMPFFDDFVFETEHDSILLQWQEKGNDLIFGAHQISDGSLRLWALLALLLQPEERLPSLLIIDEPELGLHPYAISVIAGILKSLALSRQLIIATQSAEFLDYFDPEDIVVVDRVAENPWRRESHFSHLDVHKLHEWIEEYTLAELWNKNVLGGRP